MPPPSLVKKVSEYELSVSSSRKKQTKNNKAKSSVSAKKRTPSAKSKKRKTSSVSKSAVSSSRSKAKNKTNKKTAAKKSTKSPGGNANECIRSPTATESAEVIAGNLRAKLEISPNNRAACRSCSRLIRAGQYRIGFRSGHGSYRYYHATCCPKDLRSKLPQHILRQLPPLRAKPLETSYMPSLNIVPQMNEIMAQIHRVEMARIADDGPGARPAGVHAPRQRNDRPEVIVIDDSDDEDDDVNNTQDGDDSDDDEIAVEETLTCAEIVQQKFDRAKENGEILTID